MKDMIKKWMLWLWWSKNEEDVPIKEESTDEKYLIDKEESVDLSDMPPLEGDEEVKKRKGLQILTRDKLLT